MAPLDLVAAIHAGTLDPGAPVAAALAAVAAANPRLNAIVDHDPDLAEPQIAALRARLRAGERPPLAGLPVTVKDHIHVAGWRATEGSALLRDRVAPADDPAVARLRAAGAILIGRSNMSEFGCKGVTTNRLYGPTRHPLDPALTPGGSSGGAASATAAGFCALALASDGGGSVRRPAAHVGVVGFKPSGGAIPNPRSPSHTSVLGMMARQVATVAAAFAALRGRAPADPFSVDIPADAPDPRALRLAWAPTLGLDAAADDAALAAGEAAVARLTAAGFTVSPAAPAWPAGAGEAALMPLQHAALAAAWGPDWTRDPDAFDPDIAVQIEAGLGLSGPAVAAAEALSRAVARSAAAFFAGGPDLLLALTTPCAAWPLDRLGPERVGGAPADPRAHAALTPLVNHALLPAVSIPCGADAAGLPYGLQVIGPRLSDDRVLAAAAALAPIVAGG
jgi:aspartyl-tRNA(Asn)/glutamyl-tRNA(Gln) amidotransferase subunit A